MAPSDYDGTPPAPPNHEPDGTLIYVRVDSSGGMYIHTDTGEREAAMTKPTEA